MLTAAGVVLAAAAAFDRREGFIVALFLVSLVLASSAAVLATRVSPGVERRPPSEVLPIGRDADVGLRVSMRRWDASVTRWRDEVPPSFGPSPSGGPEQLEALGTDDAARARYGVRPESRGEFLLGPFVVTREDPFGLVRRDETAPERTTVVVSPHVDVLARAEMLQPSGDGARQEHRAASQSRVDELIAREYRPGDPMRRIHWGATARRGEIMVRQEEREVDPSAVVLLDTTIRGSVDDEAFEHLVDLSASIAMHVLEAGFRLTLVESTADGGYASRSFVPSQSSEVLHRLALVTSQRPSPAARADSRSADALGRLDAAIPVIAVLAEADQATARRVAPLARGAGAAIVFASDDRGTRQGLDALRAAGWLAATVDPRRTVPEIWEGVVLRDRGPVVVR